MIYHADSMVHICSMNFQWVLGTDFVRRYKNVKGFESSLVFCPYVLSFSGNKVMEVVNLQNMSCILFRFPVLPIVVLCICMCARACNMGICVHIYWEYERL